MPECNAKFGYLSHVLYLLIYSKYQEKYKHKQGKKQKTPNKM